MVLVSDVLAVAERLWPRSLAEDWDNPGLAVGSPAQPVSRILLAVDPTPGVIDEATARDCQMVFTHHPVLFHSPTTLREDRWPGALLSRAVKAGIALFSAHTNADAARGWVNDSLARALGVENTRPLVVATASDADGIGRLGQFSVPSTLESVARRLASVLPPTAAGVLVQGDRQRSLRTVALCSGSGADFLTNPDVLGCDVYVTSDLKHHEALDVRSRGECGLEAPALLCISHWAGESLWLEEAARELTRQASVECLLSTECTDPWDFRISSSVGE